MEEPCEAGGLDELKGAVNDLKDTLIIRAAQIHTCLDQHRKVLEKFNVRLGRMETDFAIVKEYLLMRMREDERGTRLPVTGRDAPAEP